MESAPQDNPAEEPREGKKFEESATLNVDRTGYTFPPHPSGSHWDPTPDGYEGEDGRAYFADGTLDEEAMTDIHSFGVDGRTVDDRFPGWMQMLDEARAHESKGDLAAQSDDPTPPPSS